MSESTEVQTVFPDQVWETAAPESQGVHPAGLDAAMRHMASLVGTDGASQTVVVRHGRIIWRGDHIDSWHNVFSCTKSFLSIVTGLLIDDGKLSAETRLYEFVPALKEFYPDMTAARCLSMTCGYSAVNLSYPFTPAPPLFKDGAAFHYHPNNVALNMLALALTKAGGEPLDSLFKRRIADPIGMGDRWIWGDFGYVDGVKVNGGGGCQFKGIHISAEGIARVGLLLLNKGKWNGQQLLSAGWIAKATVPQSPASLPMHDPNEWYKTILGAYGYGFWVNGIRPDGKRIWPDAPVSTFALQGNYNNICFVVPDWDMVIARLGTDSLRGSGSYNEMFIRLKPALKS